MMKYQLKAKLTVIHDDNNSQKSCYTLLYAMNILRDVGQNATIYDKELKMHFEDHSALATIYEMEIENIYLNLDKSLAKATDFIRRTFYRYDWMELRVNRKGKVLAVENGKEALSQWKEIRGLLLEDYKGKQAQDYIERIGAQMAEGDFSIRPIAQYFYFGLLFPAIPAKHALEWQHHRTIELSDFEDMQFDEQIRYERTTDSQLREYSISGKLIDTEYCELKKYSGYFTILCNDIHPVEAQVEVSYDHRDMNVNWEFKLMKL